MATKAIRKVFTLGKKHTNQRYFTLPKPWLRYLEGDLHIVPDKMMFEMMGKTLIIKPFLGKVATEHAAQHCANIMRIGVTSAIVGLPDSWCVMCEKDLGTSLQWVWVRIRDDAVTLEPATKEEHVARANYYRRRARQKG